MDPHAIHAIIYRAQTRGNAIEALQQARTDAGLEPLTRDEAQAALWAELKSCGWALLTAPELHAAYEEWQACLRLEDDLGKLRDDIELLRAAYREPRTMVLIEVKTDTVKESRAGLIGERKIGPDVGSVRLRAIADSTAVVSKLEDAYARARSRFLKAVGNYQRSLYEIEGLPVTEVYRRIMARAWKDGELDIARAAIPAGEPALKSGAVETVMASLSRRLSERSTLP